ncbi:MAG TPA: hypothetical protein VMU42_05900, partial [Candidatus Sulfotelmatobacter sp.]|nr:hypothetical protein [Candidatus Sulfotelmatobacter sp.]
LGWTPATYDAHNAFVNLLHTRDLASHKGEINVDGWSNAKFDQLTDAIAVETDKAKRYQMIDQANELLKEQVPVIPLHQQVVVWAMRKNIDVTPMADNEFPLRLVTVK